MMTKLPDCARCGEDELWLVPGTEIRVKCYWCGFDSGVIAERDGLTKSELIDRAVRDAKAIGAQRG